MHPLRPLSERRDEIVEGRREQPSPGLRVVPRDGPILEPCGDATAGAVDERRIIEEPLRDGVMQPKAPVLGALVDLHGWIVVDATHLGHSRDNPHSSA
jgi:hypothetical protein